MHFLSRLKLRTKMTLLLGLSALAVIASIGLAASQMQDRMLTDRIDKLRTAAQMFIGLAHSLEQQIAAGQLTHEAAVAQLAAEVKVMHFDKGDGFVVFQTKDGLVLVHGGKPELNGKRALGKDASGRSTNELGWAAVQNSDEGVISYTDTRPGQTVSAAKIAYVARFDPWQAVVFATGYVDDINAASRSALLRLGTAGGIVLLVTLLAAWLVNRDIAASLGGLKLAMDRLAKGDLAAMIPGTGRRDEIGGMAATVEIFKQNAIEKRRLEESANSEEQAKRARQQEEIDQLVGFFGRSVGGVFKALSITSKTMADTSSALEASAAESGDQTRLMLTEVGHTTASVQTVAAASQELSASIEEIGRQASESSRISSAAMEQSDAVVGKVAELREAAQQIGTVVDLISSIATQTNLLALNATIEAARAGEAGKGFAVVASEVKSLANQTGKATEQIGGQIAAIQAATVGAAEAIQGIASTIRQVSEIATSIASAVVEQSSATREISRSVDLVSTSTASVAQSVKQVSSAVAGNGDSAAEVKRTAETLSSESAVLSTEVKDFLDALQNLSGGETLRSLAVDVAATVMANGRSIAGRVVKLSPGFALFVGSISVTPGTLMELRIEGIDQGLAARFVEPGDGGIYLQLPLNHEHLNYMAQMLNRLELAAAA